MTTTIEDVWEAWAPTGATWSPWAKPVLIAQIEEAHLVPNVSINWQTIDVSMLPASGDHAALVIDLPDIESVRYGLALAKRGFRPVPLFNVCSGPAAVVPVNQLQAALVTMAPDLAAMNVGVEAPPAFLLDANRQKDSRRVKPGQFDNRWLTFPQDFPSAELLRSRGIDSAVYLQKRSDQPREDLAHVLLRWQEGGLRIAVQNCLTRSKPQPIAITRPKSYRSLWYRALALFGLRRNSAGGFGAIVPEPSSSSGVG